MVLYRYYTKMPFEVYKNFKTVLYVPNDIYGKLCSVFSLPSVELLSFYVVLNIGDDFPLDTDLITFILT